MGSSTPFPRSLRWYAAFLFACAIAAAIALAATEGRPPALPIVVLGGLLVLTRYRDITLPSGVALTPGFIVSMAAVVVFVEAGSLLGALLVGMLNGLYLPSLTRKSWPWVPFNAAVSGLALLSAAGVLALEPSAVTSSIPVALAVAILPAITVTAVMWSLITLSYYIESRQAPAEMFAELGALFLQAVPFAVLGFLLGRLYVLLGAGVMLLIVVPIVIAREMFASYMRVKDAHEETVGMLVHALEQKDVYTAGHAERVATYARYMGEELSFMPARLERLRFAALMHDIGKLVVPNHLLNKPGRLTADEFAQVRIHEKVSVQMLSHIDFLRPIAGSGHSENTRFKADDPDHPIEPYIVMIADAYDAMTSTRAYRRALTQEIAFQELRDKAGTQFHPECVEMLIRAIETRGERHGAGFEQQSEFVNAPETGLGSAGLGDLLPSETA